MTTMNQTFIKAFRPDSGASGAPAPTFVGRAAVAAADLSTTVHILSVGETYSLSTLDLPTTTPDAAPRLDSETQPLPAAPQEDRPSLRVHQPSSDKRPLSSYVSGREDDSLRTASSRGSFQPASKVAAFRWPAVCRTLGQRCADPLDGVAETLVAQADQGHGLIGVMALHSGQGCTSMSLCLAARLAKTGRRTIVVDANFAAPQMAALLGVQPTIAWQDVLERGVPSADAVIYSEADRIALMPLDNRPTNGPRLAIGLQPAITAGVLLDAYDVVLVDLGAIFEPLSQASILELVRNMRVDAALLVSGSKPADPRELAVVGQLLEQRGCKVLGTIENRVQA
jgi:Mrp family chromosome partitioning ATPase